jgi:hypothetical protein
MSINLDGVNQYINDTWIDLSSTLQVSVMSWVTFNAVAAGTMLDRRGSAFDFQFYYTGTFWRVFAGGTPFPITQNNFTPIVGTRYHIGFVFANNDASNCKIFLNGVDDTASCNAKPLTSNGDAMTWGANTLGTERINAIFDDMRIYDRIVQDDEWKIISDEKGADNITNGLLRRFIANENSDGQAASSLTDISPQGVNATPVNSPIYLIK